MSLRKVIKSGLFAGILVALVLLAFQPQPGWGIKILPPIKMARWPMPEFTNQHPDAWVNSRPLQVADLRGKVILIKVWTTS